MATTLAVLPTNAVPPTIGNIGGNGVTGLPSAPNSSFSQTIGAFPVVGQYYFNVPFPNNQVVLYKLEIKLDPKDTNVFLSYVFPLSPSSINKSSIMLTNYFDVDG